jgi:hypothetical protein
MIERDFSNTRSKTPHAHKRTCVRKVGVEHAFENDARKKFEFFRERGVQVGRDAIKYLYRDKRYRERRRDTIMSKNATAYVAVSGATIIERKTKRQAVIDAADAHRDATGEGVVVVSVATGKIAHVRDAKRTIRMSAPYTRVVPVPDDVVEVIDGARVAYKRGPKARQFALLDDAKGAYRIWDVERRENVAVEVATTREAGRWFADERRAYADATPVEASNA